jgi:hypothetical protein
METNTAQTTLRARLIANSAIVDDDPFAGDDILWADDDWPGHATMDENVGLRFWSGLLLGFGVSAIGWFALAGSAYLVYRFIT